MFKDSKKKSIIKKIEKELNKNWKKEYFETLFEEFDRESIESYIAMVNEYNSGKLDLGKFTTEEDLKYPLRNIQYLVKKQKELLKENNDPELFEQKKEIIEELIYEIESNWKESYTAKLEKTEIDQHSTPLELRRFKDVIQHQSGTVNLLHKDLRWLKQDLRLIKNFISTGRPWVSKLN